MSKPITDNQEKTIIVSNDHLWAAMRSEIAKHGPFCSLNHFDVSRVENFAAVFRGSNFNGDISEWNVGQARSMYAMFKRSSFNGDISKWNVTKVRDMAYMFQDSLFDGDLSCWRPQNVKTMSGMFQGADFSGMGGEIDGWMVSPDVLVTDMFAESQFVGNIDAWGLEVAWHKMFGASLPTYQHAQDERQKVELMDVVSKSLPVVKRVDASKPL